MPKFTRPESLPFPTTYREFSTCNDNGFKFRIQEIPEELFDEAIDLLDKHLFNEETIHVSKKIAESAEKREISKQFYREAMNEILSIGCFDENSGELVAINVMAVSSKDDEKHEVKSFFTKHKVLLKSNPFRLKIKLRKKSLNSSITSQLNLTFLISTMWSNI